MNDVIAALEAGEPVVLPFDTVYGLAAEPFDEESTRRLYALKGRTETQPTALVAADVERLARARSGASREARRQRSCRGR